MASTTLLSFQCHCSSLALVSDGRMSHPCPTRADTTSATMIAPATIIASARIAESKRARTGTRTRTSGHASFPATGLELELGHPHVEQGEPAPRLALELERD